MVRPMRKTRAPTQSQRAIGHIAALQSIATMFVMHAMVGRSTLQFKMPRLDAYAERRSPHRQVHGAGMYRNCCGAGGMAQGAVVKQSEPNDSKAAGQKDQRQRRHLCELQ